jgi:hypothetical protein
MAFTTFICAQLGGKVILEQVKSRNVSAVTATKRPSLGLAKKHQVISQPQKAQRSAVMAMAAATEASTVSGTMAELKKAGK